MVAKRHKITNVPLFKKLKVIVPQKKNYVPQFLKQRDINSYFVTAGVLHPVTGGLGWPSPQMDRLSIMFLAKYHCLIIRQKQCLPAQIL
jgi:hypothetical protein